MAKGSDFERDFCKRLSLWWAGRDDVFWRASNSGGRATVRKRGGKATAGQYGDIAATDPDGEPLIDLVVWELKRGYNRRTAQDVVDLMPTTAVQEWEGFVRQAWQACQDAGSFSWVLVQRRDLRAEWLWFPMELLKALRGVGAFAGARPCPSATVYADFRNKKKGNPVRLELWGTTSDNFFRLVRRCHFEALVGKV